jgi:DNA-binding NarL/FixJ family response regulator
MVRIQAADSATCSEIRPDVVRSPFVRRSHFDREPVRWERSPEPALGVVVHGSASIRATKALLAGEYRLGAMGPTIDDLIGRCQHRQPDAVVIEIGLDGHGPIRALRRVREALPDARIVVIADPPRDHDVRRALRAGADGLVLESNVEHALAPTVRAVMAGQLVMPRRHRHHLEKRALSYREQQVLSLVIRGATNRQAADALVVAESTVKGHLASAFAKLGVRSRAEAAAVLLDAEAEPGQALQLSVWPPDRITLATPVEGSDYLRRAAAGG